MKFLKHRVALWPSSSPVRYIARTFVNINTQKPQTNVHWSTIQTETQISTKWCMKFKNVVYIYTVYTYIHIYFLSHKKNVSIEILMYTQAWINLESIKLNERGQWLYDSIYIKYTEETNEWKKVHEGPSGAGERRHGKWLS